MCQPSDKGRDEEAERRNHEARVRIAQRLLDETERARREEDELNQPKKPGFWHCLADAIGESIGNAKFGQ